uniref:Extensin domain-containing protein n=1 Tax=Fagus sylvatica TaxID=28930 RepID=A0A2N9FZ03_FAGSY
MATNLNQVLSTLLLALIFLNFPGTIKPEVTCPYPCYPPPTGPGTTTTPAATTTPPPPYQTVSYPPPTGFNPTTLYNPPPPNGNNLFGAPPPPDPILPYFPYYYREPLHGTDQSSANTLGRSNLVMMALPSLLVFVFM